MLLHALTTLAHMLLFGAFTYLVARTFGQRYAAAKSGQHQRTAAAIALMALLALAAATHLALRLNENYFLLIPGFLWMFVGYLAVPEPEDQPKDQQLDQPKRRVRCWAFFDI